jgi:hypothetical protein
MTKFKTQTRWIAIASAAVVAVVLISGCTTIPSPQQVLEKWNVGENKDLVLVRTVEPLNRAVYEPICKEGKYPRVWGNHASVDEEQAIFFIQKEVCPSISQWRTIGGFVKSDFGKGSMLAVGLVRPDLSVDVDDIVETSKYFNSDGRSTRPILVARTIRKNALKERDPTCYWDGQSGRFDSFATGGVVCPDEGWDWRGQKWSKK